MVYLKILFIFFLICIFLFYMPQPNFREDFITWYLPFYNKGTRELTSNTPKYLTSNLAYSQLKFDYIKNIDFNVLTRDKNPIQKNYYDFLISNLTKSLQVEKIKLNYSMQPLKLIDAVNNNPNNLSIVSAPLLMKLLSEDVKRISNINVVITANYRYLFFITTKFKQISSLTQLNDKIINVGIDSTDEYHLGKDILQNLKIKFGINTTQTNYNLQEAIRKLICGEIDGMFFTDLYPSQFLDDLILKDLDKIIVLLPLTGFNYDLFKQRHPYIKEVAIDLNSLPPNYLPVKVRTLKYTKFKPDLISYKYPDIVVCNKDAQPRVSYKVVKGIVDNLQLINNSKFFIKNRWNYLAFPEIAENLFIPIHVGAKVFYNQITVNTTNPSEICKYFIGNAKCDDKRIEGAKVSLTLH